MDLVYNTVSSVRNVSVLNSFHIISQWENIPSMWQLTNEVASGQWQPTVLYFTMLRPEEDEFLNPSINPLMAYKSWYLLAQLVLPIGSWLTLTQEIQRFPYHSLFFTSFKWPLFFLPVVYPNSTAWNLPTSQWMNKEGNNPGYLFNHQAVKAAITRTQSMKMNFKWCF